MNVEQLQAENAALKADLKTVKVFIVNITDHIGVSNKGVFSEEKVKIQTVVKSIIKELTAAITPSFFGKKEENFIDKLEFKPLVEVLKKYKD
ncbi:MAG: hypothetical protein NTZ59_02460 [Bacteroidetes bacterium]|nr:hypothetical protein [Bacteroidota bacterium]